MPPANDDWQNATPVTADVNLANTTVAATAQAGEKFFSTTLTDPSVWYRVVATGTQVTFDVTASDYDWWVTVWQAAMEPPGALSDIMSPGGTLLNSFDVFGPGPQTVSGLSPGDVLYVRVANADFDGTSAGTFTLAISDLGGGGGNGGGGGSSCDIVVTIDGVDVSGVAITGSATRRLNRPSQATITIPMWEAIGGPGSRLKISFDGGNTIFFHGFVLDCETDTAEDGGRTVYNATDPMELWQWRVVRDADGDFSKPTIIEDYVTGPQIIEAALHHSIGDGDSTGTGPPLTAEGDIFLDFGTFAGGGVDLTGAPTDWPMTISQLSSLLLSTGEVDLVITPTDPGGGVMGTIDGYNGDYGTDLSGSVVFEYGMGDYSVRALRWNEDMSGMVNKLQYYLGPRVGTPEDPAGDQHWRANVQSFDPDFTPPGGAMVPPGGKSVDATNTPIGPPWTNNQLGQRIYESRFTGGPAGTGYGVRMDVRIYDARGDEATVGRELYKRLWQIESWLRAVPRDLVHITPIRGYPLGTFDIGDLVGVNCVSTVRGGFSGAQRVYGYTISWSEDGPCELSELQTSSDQEGF